VTVAADGLVSGQRYRVTAVDGRRPAGLDHCVGARVLTVSGNGLSHRMFGRGVETSGVFRFLQRDLGADGTAVLVWAISESGDGTLVIDTPVDD
jgi:hypothetical protein